MTKLIAISRDKTILTVEDSLGRFVTIRVGTFERYRGETVLVESIDRETLEVQCTNEDGREYSVNPLGFD